MNRAERELHRPLPIDRVLFSARLTLAKPFLNLQKRLIGELELRIYNIIE